MIFSLLCATCTMTDDTRFLNLRLKEPMKTRVAAFEDKTGVSAVSLTNHLLDAAMNYFEMHNEIALPVIVMPASKAAMLFGAPVADAVRALEMASRSGLNEDTTPLETPPQKKVKYKHERKRAS